MRLDIDPDLNQYSSNSIAISHVKAKLKRKLKK